MAKRKCLGTTNDSSMEKFNTEKGTVNVMLHGAHYARHMEQENYNNTCYLHIHIDGV